jgi:5-methylcytosine-specific restriction protein B
MTSKPEGTEARACWFVGASYDRTNDQTPRFLQEGIWENGYQDKYLELVKSIQVGDRIAIKSSYTRKHDLPFDNRAQTVSVMTIKAIGKVNENLGDGRTLKVDWKPFDPPREWYFYTNRSTIWRVLPGDWPTDALIGFTFEEKTQDINRFRNAPYWRERFGDSSDDKRRFHWTRFYEAVADKLLTFKNRRDELISRIHAIGRKVDCMSILNDQYQKSVPGGPLKDICPFTVMGIFNRGITDANRKTIANELASLLGVSEPVPDSFEGIPVLNNQRSCFFGYSYKRQPDDIDTLWEAFAQAIAFAESDDADSRSAFAAAYDNATLRWGVGWNLTMGLYWIRPWNFPTLDGQSQHYISKKLNTQIGMNGPKGRCNASDYLAVLDTLEARFQEDAYPVSLAF